MKDITTAEKEQMRIAEEEMDDMHGHNSEGCYGQGTHLDTYQKNGIDAEKFVEDMTSSAYQTYQNNGAEAARLYD